MKHILPKLPYEMNALEPFISSETLNFHYGKHHSTYIDNLNSLIIGTEFEKMELEDIIKNTHSLPMFNNAAQVWNHTFYFFGLTGKKINPKGKILEFIIRDFGDFESFKKDFTKSAIGNFGSGWTWLLLNGKGKLEIINTQNAKTPLTIKSKKPLLTCDVWEHAYYIDTRNSRVKYLENFWNIIDWERVENLLLSFL